MHVFQFVANIIFLDALNTLMSAKDNYIECAIDVFVDSTLSNAKVTCLFAFHASSSPHCSFIIHASHAMHCSVPADSKVICV